MKIFIETYIIWSVGCCRMFSSDHNFMILNVYYFLALYQVSTILSMIYILTFIQTKHNNWQIYYNKDDCTRLLHLVKPGT